MDEREYLVKAQEAEAIADAAANPRQRSQWEAIAHEYRKLAAAEVELRQVLPSRQSST
jgi:hypothetical protein